jgi:putative glutamine amidotransferase
VVVVAGILDTERRASYLPDSYSDAITAAGGLPLIRPPGLGSPALVEALLDHADGLLVPGGRDFDTERLGLGPVHPKARPVPVAQQDADVALVARAVRRGIPVLGICYGMQLLGLVGGGCLHQHLPDDAPGTIAHQGEAGGDTAHEVILSPWTRTAAALGLPAGGRLTVRSAHHQALARTGPQWQVTGRDSDGLIEAIERPGPSLAIGVQWHPERGELLSGLFTALVGAAGEAAARGTAGPPRESVARDAAVAAGETADGGTADAPRDVVASS